MKLSEIQRQFSSDFTTLRVFLHDQGYEMTEGDAMRDPRAFGQMGERKAYGQAYSNHKVRLAHDINLFVDGKYIADGNHPAYKELGEYWESIRPENAWGGRFGDANHFSREYRGRK